MKKHSWNANSWVVRKDLAKVSHGRNDWKKFEWANSPLANHLIMTGLVATVGGVPIDLGFPGWINLKACEKAKLLEL